MNVNQDWKRILLKIFLWTVLGKLKMHTVHITRETVVFLREVKGELITARSIWSLKRVNFRVNSSYPESLFDRISSKSQEENWGSYSIN